MTVSRHSDGTHGDGTAAGEPVRRPGSGTSRLPGQLGASSGRRPPRPLPCARPVRCREVLPGRGVQAARARTRRADRVRRRGRGKRAERAGDDLPSVRRAGAPDETAGAAAGRVPGAAPGGGGGAAGAGRRTGVHVAGQPGLRRTGPGRTGVYGTGWCPAGPGTAGRPGRPGSGPAASRPEQPIPQRRRHRPGPAPGVGADAGVPPGAEVGRFRGAVDSPVLRHVRTHGSVPGRVAARPVPQAGRAR